MDRNIRIRLVFNDRLRSLITICSVIFIFGTVILFPLGWWGYNDIQKKDEAVLATWAEVVNQYQRRADLTPSLVNTVKGFAGQERNVFLGVANARAKSNGNAELLAIGESYPEIKSDKNFQMLQSSLERTEDMTPAARSKYIEAVKDFNVVVRTFPSNITAMIFGIKPKKNFVPDDMVATLKVPNLSFSDREN